jgi:hypothetical protein
MLVALIQTALIRRMVRDIVAYAMKGSKETPILNKDAKVNRWMLCGISEILIVLLVIFTRETVLFYFVIRSCGAFSFLI